jgi:hypothetical protein
VVVRVAADVVAPLDEMHAAPGVGQRARRGDPGETHADDQHVRRAHQAPDRPWPQARADRAAAGANMVHDLAAGASVS